MEGLVPDSQLNQAERLVQPRFSFSKLAGPVLIAILVLLLHASWDALPNRFPMAARTVALLAEPIAIDLAAARPMRIAGAWHLTAPDPRFGGLSALAIDRGQLLALSDSAVLYRFSPPGAGPATVAISELPDGPGSPSFKVDRDSESLARDGLGRGWWVGFENNNQLWLYDRELRRPLRRIDFGVKRWPHNLGVESLVAGPGNELRLIPELAHEVVTIDGNRAIIRPLSGVGSKISDAVRLPDGETIALLRDYGLTGFQVALGALVETPSGWRVERRVALRFGPFENLEGMTAQALPGGVTRLWLITDDNFQKPMTTALYALDAPAGPWRGAD
jgi:hypothetical protein